MRLRRYPLLHLVLLALGLASLAQAQTSRNLSTDQRVLTGTDQFARGFADTDRVRLLVEPPARMDGAAGSLFAEIPTIIIATTRSGNERVFAGCYVMRKSNMRDDARWRIYRADVSMFPSSTRVSRMLSQGCRNSQ